MNRYITGAIGDHDFYHAQNSLMIHICKSVC
jgi:hypothetical protein